MTYPQMVDSAFITALVLKIHSRPEDFDYGDIENRIWKYRQYVLTEIEVPDTVYNIDSDLVREYTTMLIDTMPPIVYDPIEETIIDGSHRVETVKVLRNRTILAYVGTDPNPDWDINDE